jgi:hypothetical protein
VAAEPSGGGSGDAVEVSPVRTAADHFGHRETDDIVVDLFWSRRVGDEFRVEVEDRREHARFVLCPTTGKEAIQAFYHPFASRHLRSKRCFDSRIVRAPTART